MKIRLFKTILFVVLMALTVLPVKADPVSLGFLAVATPSITIGTETAVIIGTIPAGTSEITVIASGPINFGPSTVTSATTWPYIADGGIKVFSTVSTRNPKIYFIQRGAGTTFGKISIIAK